MNEQVKSAMERLRQMRADADDHDGGYPATEEGRRQSLLDHAALADAYLAEHPADDDEAITEDWLREVGFKSKTYQESEVLALNIPKGVIGDTQWIELEDETNGVFLLCRWSELYEDYDGDDLPPDRVEVVCRTMGQLRRLCAALGIELTEKARTA